MEPSDWIAVGALFVAAASILFNFLTNKANMKARRTEIAIEKSIEAFREMLEKLITLENCIGEADIDQATAARDEFKRGHIQYWLYTPITISRDMTKLLDMYSAFIAEQKAGHWSDRSNKRFSSEAVPLLSNLIVRLQRHIGLETKEKAYY